MSYLDAFILGLVQGLAEFIPISSSGHLILFNEWFSLSSNFAYDIFLNIGTLLAAVVYFRKDIVQLITKYNENPLLKVLIIGTIPAVIFGALFSDYISSDSTRSVAVVTTMLLVVGVLFILESFLKIGTKSIHKLNFKNALFIGFAQALALIPGTSRSGSTILAGRVLGLTRESAARFSFLLSIPIIAGAILFSVITDPINVNNFGISNILVGIVTSFFSSIIAIHFMLAFLRSRGLFAFGVYRVILGSVLLFLL